MKLAQVRQPASGQIGHEQNLEERRAWDQRATEATCGPREGVDPGQGPGPDRRQMLTCP